MFEQYLISPPAAQLSMGTILMTEPQLVPHSLLKYYWKLTCTDWSKQDNIYTAAAAVNSAITLIAEAPRSW